MFLKTLHKYHKKFIRNPARFNRQLVNDVVMRKAKNSFRVLRIIRKLSAINSQKEKQLASLIMANRKLAFQCGEQERCASELKHAHQDIAVQYEEKEKCETQLVNANRELEFQNTTMEKHEKELIDANRELAFKNAETEKRTLELTRAVLNLQKAEEIQKEHIRGLEEMMFMTSHKVRQPITNILGLAKLLSYDMDPEEQRLIVQGMKESARILDDYTKELTSLLTGLKQISKTKIDGNP